MRIAVIGPGAIGCVVGAGLIAAGHEVTFCARQRFDRLKVQKRGESAGDMPAHVVTTPADVGPTDWTLCCVKAHQTADAADWLAGATRIAVLQNGVEHRDNVAPLTPRDAEIVPVVVDIPAARTAPGEAVWKDRADLTVQDDAAGRAFCALFGASFVRAATDPDLVSSAWKKLSVNAPGAILALTGRTMEVFHRPGIVDLARGILRECVAVGRAEGARFDDDLIESRIAGFLAAEPGEGNSIYADRMAGRKMEWQARNGVICRKGAKHGIATPVSDTLVPLLASLDP